LLRERNLSQFVASGGDITSVFGTSPVGNELWEEVTDSDNVLSEAWKRKPTCSERASVVCNCEDEGDVWAPETVELSLEDAKGVLSSQTVCQVRALSEPNCVQPTASCFCVIG
jgi:hypothetical protein